MVYEFRLPDIGEGLTEAEVRSWLVEAGETVSEDQPIVELETDKAVVDIPSPVGGTVEEILTEEGEIVPVGTVLITFETSATEPSTDDAGATSSGSETDAGGDDPTGRRSFASPTTRRIARELGVDIGSVDGSGPGGRVIEADVRAAAESAESAESTDEAPETAPDATPATRRTETPTDERRGADRDRTLAAPATRKLAAEAGIALDSVPTDRTEDGQPFVTPAEIEAYAAHPRAQTADAEAVSAPTADGDERIPYQGVRRTIGERMVHSKSTAPHATHHDEADVTELVDTRGRLKGRAEERGSSLSYLPFVIKAVVAGLKAYPIVNSQLDEEADEIVVRGEYNIGVATATDAGLVVPVLEAADRKGLLALADEMNDLIERARNRTIDREEMRGGTFTITNFGAIGGEYATPIINYPETAILGVGEIKEKPRVVDGEVVPRKVMTLSLTIDHRVIDGAEAARFMNTVIESIESPALLLLE